jgi:glycosyltransferase involved in cell wall biosynthesis
MSKRIHLSLVMPAYNEAAGIAESVAEAQESLIGLGYEFEILVIDDGSTDRTSDIVDDLSGIWPRVRLIRHGRNLGYGAALRTGFEAARFDLVAFTDADGQFFLEDLDDLVTLSRECPIVVGRRVDRQDPRLRRFYSWGYNKLVRFFLGTGVRDVDCALKVFRRDVLEYLLPTTRGFFVNAEMLTLARRYGWDVAEVGVRHRSRRYGVSKVSIVEIPKTMAKLLGYWWKHIVVAAPLPAVRPAEATPILRLPARTGRPHQAA